MPKPKVENGGDYQKYILVSKKIEPQFPDTPCGRLAHAIITQALKDTILPGVASRDIASARHYLTRKSIPHAELAGVDSHWIRSVATRIGFPL